MQIFAGRSMFAKRAMFAFAAIASAQPAGLAAAAAEEEPCVGTYCTLSRIFSGRPASEPLRCLSDSANPWRCYR